MTSPTDAELLARQDGLQAEAAAFAREHALEEPLGRAGRVIPLGSVQTGLMVWRDYDVVVDAHGLGGSAAFETMTPILGRSRTARYEDDCELGRHYFVLRVPSSDAQEWKLDVSFFVAGLPPGLETAPRDLCAGLTPERRLAILRLKDAWHRHPAYPELVGAVHIYDAVLEHGVGTLAALDEHLAARGLPTLEP